MAANVGWNTAGGHGVLPDESVNSRLNIFGLDRPMMGEIVIPGRARNFRNLNQQEQQRFLARLGMTGEKAF